MPYQNSEKWIAGDELLCQFPCSSVPWPIQ